MLDNPLFLLDYCSSNWLRGPATIFIYSPRRLAFGQGNSRLWYPRHQWVTELAPFRSDTLKCSGKPDTVQFFAFLPIGHSSVA